MSEGNWGQLIRKQDQYVHDEDYKKRQKNLHLKQLYKIQLQKMINQQKNKSGYQKHQEKVIMEKMKNSAQVEQAKQDQRSDRLRHMRQFFAHENLNTITMRRQEHEDQVNKQKSDLQKKFRKVETEMSQEKYQYVRSKEHQRNQLAHAYDDKLVEERQKRFLERVEDRKYSDAMMQAQNQKEKERIVAMNKIKFGYRQNPEAFEKAEEDIANQYRQRNGFLDKIISENERSRADEKRKNDEKQRKARQIKEASEFNRSLFQDRVFKKRHDSIKETLQAHQQWETINEQLQRQKHDKIMAKNDQRNKYKNQLERQIEETHKNRNRQRLMSNKEARLNKGILAGGQSVLPGLSQDYSIRRQQHIMENFLNVSQQSTQF